MNNADKITIGTIEDSISKEITKFYARNLGQGPRETRVFILKDMVIIRLKGRLVPLEKKLLESERGIGLVKNIHKFLHELLTKHLRDIVENITKYKVISSHSDISTKTGEVFEAFILETDYEMEITRKAIR